MNFDLEFRANSAKLYNGRRSFFAVFRCGSLRFWVMRWDTARAPKNRFRTGRGPQDMGWTWGTR